MSGAQVGQKRPRQESRPLSSSALVDVIEISSDDESSAPALKRQKSTPPVPNGVVSNGLSQRTAKSATSGAISGQSKSTSSFTSQPESREASLSRHDGRDNKPALFKSLPGWSRRAAQQQNATLPVPGTNDKEKEKAPAWQVKENKSRQHTPSTILERPARSTVSVAPSHLQRKASSESSSVLASSASALTSSASVLSAVFKTMKDPKVSSHSENAPNPLEDLEDGNSDSNSVESISDDDGPHILEKFVKPIPKALATRPPQAQAPPTPEQTTNSNISVPIRPSPSSAKTHAPAVPPPSSSQSFSLLVPLSQTKSASEHKARKRALLEELKKSTNVAKTRLPEVEKYFGQTGFSKTFAVDEQERERLLRLAPIKKKKFDPSKLVLDRGNFSNLRISDEEKNERPQHPKEMLKIIYEKRFAEHTGTPLRFRNDINDVRIDGKFQFMSAYVIRDGVRQAPLTTNRGCSCTDTCNPDKCECLIRRIQVLDETHNIIETKTISTYIAHPSDPSITVLHPDYIANELNPTVQHFEITECNEVCSCGPHCPNRVVGRERTLPLEIYMTERCGFGVRCPTKNILKGQFIDVYLGEVITEAEVRKREFIKHPEAPSYVYSLDWFTNTNCYHVDGEYFGSAMRFVNHSCSPNARSFQVQTHRGDKHVYHLALFAIRDIPAGEQITIDYCPQEALAEDVTISGSQEDGDGEGKGKGKAKSVELPGPVVEEEEGRSRCHCGSSNCRTWLWRGPGRKRRKRTVKTS